ncbi:hypothetical protein ACO11K_003923 [Bacillus cytotoxicus]|uniref:hypothetical protein n=1 Tax=Bacillus cereus group sp. BfR-BA-01492 TaxID=2920361 RepID=UPI001F56B511|nr:hypothetical protein [Bacillus cereus group sp. BfR-BA-01492]EMA6344082.1 hypothetical protein [Bacillus cytotoxicus]
MYKIILALIAMLTVLTACNRAETAKDNHDVTVKKEESSQQEKKDIDQTKDEQTAEQVKEEEPKEQSENNPKENENHEKWASLPEYNKIVEQIGNEDYNFQTVTDNEGKRVLHILDKDGQKQYKTIFIKNTNRLKIIKINGGGMIFNGPLS